MKTMKKFQSIVLVLVLFLSACSESAEIKMIKEGKLNNYPEKTIGEAVDGFFGNPKWEKLIAEDGLTYVNVSGKMTFMEKEVDGLLQFKISESGDRFEVNSFEMNEIPQNKLMLVGLINKMFEE
jgi:hypothetical protein